MQINRAYHDILKHKERFLIFYGGAGSGKSYGIAQNIIVDVLTHPGVGWLVTRAVGKTIRESIFSLMKSIIIENNLSNLFTINKTEMSFTHINNGSRIISTGLDDVEKIKSIANITHIWIEEATEIKETDFTQLNLRIRGGSIGHKMVLSFNPVSSTSWIKSRFFDIKDDDAIIFHTTFMDNAFLDDTYKKELVKLEQYDYYRYQVYTKGLWADISNARVFHNVIVEDFSYTVDDLENVRYGMDFGFIHASTLMGAGYKDGELYIFLEHYYKELTNGQFIKAVQGSGFDKSNYITADSAEPARIKEWQDSGFSVYSAKKGKGSLYDGIDYLQNLPKIHIHRANCPNAAREFLNFKRRELKDGTITEQFVELDDDTIAAVRYSQEERSLPGVRLI